MSTSNNHCQHQQETEEEEEDPYSSGDEATTTRLNTSRLRLTDRNILTVQRSISQPPPPWDPQNRSFTAALQTIRSDPSVKSHLERLEEMKERGGDGVLADVMYTEVMAVIVHAARAVSLAGTRMEGDEVGEGEGEGETEEEFETRISRRARTVGNFCWISGVHPSVGGTEEEGDVVRRPSAGDGLSRMGEPRRSGGERGGCSCMKMRRGL